MKASLNCYNVTISMHALKAMIKRSITVDEVMDVIENGEIIADYPSDKPYPSSLALSFVNSRPIHVVVAIDANNNCIIITCYQPDPALWDISFKNKL